jgi:phosphate:Na+ symporter
MGTMVLLDLMGGVALLLWGLHMVHSGILRAFGSDLRQLLSKALGNRFAAFAAGLGLTALLQSSTATALMTASFTAEGLVGLVPALAIVLGANVGTTLIVQLLSFNISVVAPVLFVIGVVAFRGGARTRVKDLGRVACRTLSSRAEEFHLRALPKPCVNLSIHTAPDVRPLP